MTRLAAPLLVLVLALGARAQAPVGRFDVAGGGSLEVEEEGAGYRLTRRAGGQRWSGVADLRSDLLVVDLRRSGLADLLLGPRPGAVHAEYRLQDDGSWRGGPAGTLEAARLDTRRLSRGEYFRFLDRVPGFRRLGRTEALPGLLALVARPDVPAALDRGYADEAGSPGGGRVLLALDYTRGMDTEPTWAEAWKDGPKRVVSAKLLTPMLTHFRAAGGEMLFVGDVGFAAPFRDSQLTSPRTNQVGHLLCAVDTGIRHGKKRGVARWAYERALVVAGRVFGLAGVQPTIADWSRAGVIGHELVGDEDGSGFVGQMNAYGRLVANGDPHGVRAAWDTAVAAVLNDDHLAAWRAIRRIARAGQVPETADEVARNLADPAPRFARPGAARGGNSLQDLALSVYGFALGQRAVTTGYSTPAAARDDLAAHLAADGAQAAAIVRAAAQSRDER